MRNTFYSCVILLLSTGYAAAQAICAGQTVALQAQNPSNLSSPSYSMEPGGATHPTGLFVFSPTVTGTYTLYTSGTNSSSQFTTTTAVHNVTVYAQPQIAPTVTNFACNTTTNAFNLNLTFNPASPVPSYTITWAADPATPTTPNIPPGWTNNQTSMQGTVVPSSYTPIVTAPGGCTASVVFSVTPPPAPAVFTLQPAPDYSLTCDTRTINVFATAASTAYTYTFSSSNTGQIATPSVVLTATNMGVWTVSGENTSSGCSLTFTFSLGENTVTPVSTISSTFQNITCAQAAEAVTVSATSPTVNYTHFIYSASPSLTWVANSSPAYYQVNSPGTYTYVLKNNVTGCVAIKNFTISGGTSNFPTYGLNSSPGGFTLGCAETSSATITFTNAQSTIPPGGGAVSYTLVYPGNSYTATGNNLSQQTSYPVNIPGTYTAVVHDNANDCETMFAFSVLTNTQPPVLDTIITPTRILDCFTDEVVIQGLSSTEGVSYSWNFPATGGGIGTQGSSTYTVKINPFVDPSQILIATYTFNIQENNNRCITSTTLEMYQNLFKPTAFGAAATSSLTCLTTTILLTNFSSSNVPPNSIFTTGKTVNAILWQGPSPQVPLQNSSSYVAEFPGDYTLTVRDENNGCEATTTIPIFDGRNTPLVNFPDTARPNVLDCGAADVTLVPFVSHPGGSPLSYSWTVPPSATAVGDLTLATLTVQDTGYYVVRVMDDVSKCFDFDTMYVVNGDLTASISPQGSSQGYAPFDVTFINNSFSSLGNDSIITIWSFGNDSVIKNTANDLAKTKYTQPGTYTVVAFVQKGVCIDTAYHVISVDIPSQMVVPNVFTPNDDDVNDVFFLQRSVNLSNISAKIFDRWGNVVYELSTDKMNIEWDGTNQLGKKSPAGVYLYIITGTGKDGKPYDEKGTVTLLR